MIVGIGSSAGGIDVLRDLAPKLSIDPMVSYVVVQHMSPHDNCRTCELIGRETRLAVKGITDGARPEPGVIHVAPPGVDVIFRGGLFRLVGPCSEIGAPTPSIDRFLISLADGHGPDSVAIILSGKGRDGALGAQAVREAGGATIAQDGKTAKYDEMPLAALQTGCIDLVLSPSDIGAHLNRIATPPRASEEFRPLHPKDDPLTDLMQILLDRTRVDFREYKRSAVERSIEQRMDALGIDSIDEFTRFCRHNPQATDALFKDILNSVTRFFRDRAAFESLKMRLPALIEDRDDERLRVWIAGCATGEEAYSIAFLFAELLGGPTVDLKSHIQVFATDIDQDALHIGRTGVYEEAALGDVPDDIAERYFVRQSGAVQVIDTVKNAILFSQHNLCQDPPFQKIDLLCCRYLLIYFGQILKQRVLSRFHHSLCDSGVLYLGTAESIAGSEDLFIQDDGSAQFYRSRAIDTPALGHRTGRLEDSGPAIAPSSTSGTVSRGQTRRRGERSSLC